MNLRIILQTAPHTFRLFLKCSQYTRSLFSVDFSSLPHRCHSLASFSTTALPELPNTGRGHVVGDVCCA